ncbi:HEAT repeat domain-containing protein [Planctomycetota bacterium]
MGDAPPQIDWAKALQAKGYKTDTPEQIIEATQSSSYTARYKALVLLTERIGKQAIQTLKKSLSDPKLKVRWTAAHLLKTVGDTSGLEQMQKDFDVLVPDGNFEFVLDPNATEKKIRDQWGKWALRSIEALEVAKVLAELGDTRGYKLAATIVMYEHVEVTKGGFIELSAMDGNGALDWHRFKALMVLIEIAKMDKEKLKRENINPLVLLKAIAASEKHRSTFNILTNQVKLQLPKEDAIEILEIAKNNQHQSESTRRGCQFALQRIKSTK